jgi:hypothetical protein
MRTTLEHNALFSIFCAAVVIVAFTSLLSESTPDQYLPELAKDYVYWRAKILLCTKEGNPAKAQTARERMRRAEQYLFHSTYTEAEATAAIQNAEDFYTKTPIRGGC